MSWLEWGHLGLVPVLLWLGWWDLRSHRLPDALTLPALAASAVWLAAAPLPQSAIDRAFAGMAMMVGLFWLLAVAPGEPLGFGDVKLAAVLALQLGVHGLPVVFLWWCLSFLLGGVVASGLVLWAGGHPRQAIAFGPALIASWFIVVAGLCLTEGGLGAT